MLVGIGAAVVGIAVVVGFIVGATGAETASSVRIAGIVTLPLSGPTMAAYAGLLAVVVVGGLFAAVETAARREAETDGR